MISLDELLANHELDRWRDQQTLQAALSLNALCIELTRSIAAELKQSEKWTDRFPVKLRYGSIDIAPRVHERVKTTLAEIAAIANAALVEVMAKLGHNNWRFLPVNTTSDKFDLDRTAVIALRLTIGDSIVSGKVTLSMVDRGSDISRVPAKLREQKVREYVSKLLITGNGERKSILDRLRQEFDDAIVRVKGEVC